MRNEVNYVMKNFSFNQS